MEGKDNKTVSLAAFEGAETRSERRDKRKDIIILVLVIVLLLNNVAWLLFFNQFDYATKTITQGTEAGDNSYIGEDGVINNGEPSGN